MNFRQLQYFVAVAEERHFGRAAARLHISQPPLSQQMKALEDQLGCALLLRTTRRVELTPAGEALLVRAGRILDDVDAAVRETLQVHRGEAGQVVMSFVGSATYELLPQLVRAVRSQLPGVRLVIESERLTPEQEESLLDHRSDLAVLNLSDLTAASPLLSIEPIRRVPLVVALSRDHHLAGSAAIRIADLADERFLLHPSRGRSVLHQKVRELCHQGGFQPDVAQEVRETVTAVSMAAAGLGVALLPGSVEYLQVTGAVYRPLNAEGAEMIQVLATRKDDPSPVLRRLLEVVRATLVLP